MTGFLLAVYIFWTAKRPNSCRCICQDFNDWPCACRVCVLPISGLGDRSGYAGLHSLRLGYDSQWKKENAGRFCLSVLWVTSPDPLDPSKFGGPLTNRQLVTRFVVTASQLKVSLFLFHVTKILYVENKVNSWTNESIMKRLSGTLHVTT